MLYGEGVPTEIRTEFPENVARAVQTPRGDSVVPVPSATALKVPASRQFGFAGVSHSDACLNTDIRSRAMSIIKDLRATDALDDTPVLGRMAPQAAAAKLRELGEDAAATAIESAAAAATPEAASFGIFDRIWPGEVKPWQHTAHAFGYLAPASPGQDALPIRHAGEVAADSSLKNAALKITLDRMRVAAYPGGGMHRVLFDFYAQNQVPGRAEDIHFNATYRIQEGEQAAILGFPIFIGLNVGNEGVSFRCFTVNVKNDDDEAFLDLPRVRRLQGRAPPGHDGPTGAGPTLRPGPRPDQDPRGPPPERPRAGHLPRARLQQPPPAPRLAEGSYLAVQIPDAQEASWDWNAWVYIPARGQVVSKADPKKPIPYNYLVFSISRCEPTGAPTSAP